MIPTDFIFLFIIRVVFFMIRVDPSPILFYFYFFIRSELIRPGLAVRVDPVRQVISVFMRGLTIKKAYDSICLVDFRQTCFARVIGVWGRRGSIAFLIFYGSKFNVGWFGCHPGCNELRKYNRVLQLSKMSKNCINAFNCQALSGVNFRRHL